MVAILLWSAVAASHRFRSTCRLPFACIDSAALIESGSSSLPHSKLIAAVRASSSNR